MALGKVQMFGQPIQIKCASVGGTLMRISRFEFYKKIMCYQAVAMNIQSNIMNKLNTFIEKTGLRFASIKSFHSA